MTRSAPLRIGYVTIEDPNDRDAWSGTTYSMMQSLRDAGAIVDPLVVSTGAIELLSKLHAALTRQVISGRHLRNRETWYLRLLGDRASRLGRGDRFDAFVSPGTLPVSYAEFGAPLFVWTDATFPSMIDFYPSFSGLSRRTREQGMAAESACLGHCRTAVFSSKWAAREAAEAFGVANVAAVQFGANLAAPPTVPHLGGKVANWLKAPHFVLVGKDWNVKGGDRAVALVEELRRRGHGATLRVIGVEVKDPPAGDWFSATGFVSKNAADGRNALAAEYEAAHFLLILSRADCTPMVIAEAASYGVPALGSNVGGIPEQIEHGRSGLVTSSPDDPASMADALEPFLRSGEAYSSLCSGALDASTTRLNWRVAGQRMLKLITDSLG